MIRKLAVVALALATVGIANPAEAAPTARISCSTVVKLSNGGKTAQVRVKSNHPTTAKVHSYRAFYVHNHFFRKSVTQIPAGSTATFTGRSWSQVESWQSGTKCNSWHHPGILI